jgi:hypothetical protein
MKSKVPAELANRNISVRFSDLNVVDGVRKMFQGQPLDYVVIEGQGIIVTAASQTVSATDAVPVYNTPAQPPEQPFVQDLQQQPITGALPNGQQPATIQTPFGPVANPRAQQAQPAAPISAPGQQNSLFPGTLPPIQPAGQQQGAPSLPVLQPGSPTPFSTPSPFGTPNQPTNNPGNLFGTPPAYTPGAQQR